MYVGSYLGSLGAGRRPVRRTAGVGIEDMKGGTEVTGLSGAGSQTLLTSDNSTLYKCLSLLRYFNKTKTLFSTSYKTTCVYLRTSEF